MLLKSLPQIHYAFSQVSDGNMSYLWGEATEVENNRKNFFENFGISLEDAVAANLQSSSGICHVTSPEKGKGMFAYDGLECDALITKEKGLPLFFVTADCFPVLIYDPVKEVIALIHCGWRGTDERICAKVINEMVSEYGCHPENFVALIGPGIQKESYVFKDPVQKQKPEWAAFLTDLPTGETMIDLLGYNRHQLLSMGIPETQIEIHPSDTGKDVNYFSNYRTNKEGKDAGRFCTFLVMK